MALRDERRLLAAIPPLLLLILLQRNLIQGIALYEDK
jgi:ABC-type maltose transport system permease subunit